VSTPYPDFVGILCWLAGHDYQG